MVEKVTALIKKLPIRPKELPTKNIIHNVPISQIKSGKIDDQSIEIREAVVAYLDILGFSLKRDEKDIEASILDFSGHLIITSKLYSDVRFNVFSDCAFLGRDPLIGLSFVIWKSQEFLQAPDMID